MQSKVLSYQTPIQSFQKFFPENKCFTSLSPKNFGCTVFVHVHDHNRGKLDPRAIKCIFLGFSPTQKGFKCFNPSSGKFFVSMDVTFFETKPFFLIKLLFKGRTLLMKISFGKYKIYLYVKTLKILTNLMICLWLRISIIVFHHIRKRIPLGTKVLNSGFTREGTRELYLAPRSCNHLNLASI